MKRTNELVINSIIEENFFLNLMNWRLISNKLCNKIYIAFVHNLQKIKIGNRLIANEYIKITNKNNWMVETVKNKKQFWHKQRS